nr:cbb3-type cytochrome c oxidase subunit I [Phenylobacterium sp.]
MARFWSPSLWGRTSFLWAAGFAVLGAATWASGRLSGRRFPAGAAQDGDAAAYYVAAHIHYLLLAGGAFLAFALIYMALERARRGRRRRLLGGLHFAATFAGVNAIFLPQTVLGLAPGLAAGADGLGGFFLFNGVASAGYVAVLAGQLFFVAALFDAFRREPISG